VGASKLPSIETIKKYLVAEREAEITTPPAFVLEEARLYKAELAAGGGAWVKRDAASGKTKLEATRTKAKREQAEREADAEGLGQGPTKRPCGVRGLLRARREELEGSNADNSSLGTSSASRSSGSRSGTARRAVAARAAADGLAVVMAPAALKTGLEEAGVLPGPVAEIQAVAARMGADRSRCRSVLWNLKRNGQLLERVNAGLLSGAELLSLSHEDLAAQEVKLKRQRLQAEAHEDAVVRDHGTFAVVCESCGSTEARGSMVHLPAGPLDNHRDGWSQMSMRGICGQCGHLWVDGRE